MIYKTRFVLFFSFIVPLICIPSFSQTNRDQLADTFISPPNNARPKVWWRWMGGQISRAGITRDMEALKKAGFGGVVFFQLDFDPSINITSKVTPEIKIFSSEWWSMLQFAIQEANRCGLEFTFQNAMGFSTHGGPWITPEMSMQKLVWSETAAKENTTFSTTLPKPTVDAAWNYYKDIAVLAIHKNVSTSIVNEVIDLSSKMDVDGAISWKVPAGTWKIIRMGHTTTGVKQHPVPNYANGLECDKMNKDAMKLHFDNYPAKVIQAAGTTPVTVFVDSYESGMQNWSPHFREEFIKRRGYDPLLWLPTINNYVIESLEKTNRFKYDMNRTIEELILDGSYRALGEFSHQYPMVNYQIQPYNTAFNLVEGGTTADRVSGEFWHKNTNYGWWSLSLAASVAHFTGNPIVVSEAFTTSPQHANWNDDAYELKAEGDLAFARGVNSMEMHLMAHQPWDPKYKPGMQGGPYGFHINPNNTWWDQSIGWTTYLSRSQYMLRQGAFVGDICYLYPNGLRGVTFPNGYNGDAIDVASFIKLMDVVDGYLVTPGGARYRVLYMQDDQAYTPELVSKIKLLVAKGAVVIGPKPIKSVSLSNYPYCDVFIKQVADSVWGNCDGSTVKENSFGRGKVYSGKTVREVLDILNLAPDFELVGGTFSDIGWTHRRAGTTEIYFVSNQLKKNVSLNCSFRVSGLIPEIWNAETGQIVNAPIWCIAGNKTTVNLELPSVGSCFVVFRKPLNAIDHAVSMTERGGVDNYSSVVMNNDSLFLIAGKNTEYIVRTSFGKEYRENVSNVISPLSLSENWSVHFPSESGIKSSVSFPILNSWSENKDTRIKYFSGTATYRKDFKLSVRQLAKDNIVYLDLGHVRNFAEVTLNGKTLPLLWKPPYLLDITAFALTGMNHLEVKVTNTWTNRMIGDEQEPDDVSWGKPTFTSDAIPLYRGKAMAAMPSWLLNGTDRPSVGRQTFSTWNYYRSTDSLLSSGIVGPVNIVFARKKQLKK
jgi:hypothetical protein